MTILKNTPVSEPGPPDLDADHDHTVLVTLVCHSEFATEAHYPLPGELARTPSGKGSFYEHKLPATPTKDEA